MYKVCNKNLEWKGRGNGWVVIAEKEGGDDSDDEPITLELMCKVDDYKCVSAPVKRHCHTTYEAHKMKNKKLFQGTSAVFLICSNLCTTYNCIVWWL